MDTARAEFQQQPQYATTQLTSKKLKLQILLAWMLGLTSCGTFSIAAHDEQMPAWGIVSGLVFLGAVAWWLATKIRIWWHHK
jgi:hypothetical protein